MYIDRLDRIATGRVDDVMHVSEFNEIAEIFLCAAAISFVGFFTTRYLNRQLGIARASNQQSVPPPIPLEPAGKQLSSEEELNLYLNRCAGISRINLNVRAAIGVFIFGWLMKMNYDDLGEKGFGRAFLIAFAVIFVVARESGPDAVAPAIGIGLLIYAGAWVHTNILLTERKRVAKERFLQEKKAKTWS